MIVEPGFPCYKFGLKFYKRTYYNGTCVAFCPINTILSPDGRSCEPCVTGCSLCTSTGQCTAFEDGRYLDPTGICRKCVYPCIKCNGSANNCDETLKELVMYNNITGSTYVYPFCLDAIPKCSRCDIIDKAICVECKDGYYLNKGVCLKNNCDNVNCGSCDTNGDCMFCNVYYELANSSECMLHVLDEGIEAGNLPSNIASITEAMYNVKNKEIEYTIAYIESLQPDIETDNNSLDCLSGYYKSGETCLNCMDGCVDCTNGESCNQCIYPYNFDNVSLTCVIVEGLADKILD